MMPIRPEIRVASQLNRQFREVAVGLKSVQNRPEPEIGPDRLEIDPHPGVAGKGEEIPLGEGQFGEDYVEVLLAAEDSGVVEVGVDLGEGEPAEELAEEAELLFRGEGGLWGEDLGLGKGRLLGRCMS